MVCLILVLHSMKILVVIRKQSGSDSDMSVLVS